MNFHNLESENSISSMKFQNTTFLNRKLAAVVFVALVAGFAIGILIGHFAINNDSNDNNGGTSGAISGTEPPDSTSTASPEQTTISPEQTTSSQDGVFLPGVPAAIIREANETVTDWILKELNADNIRENLRNLTAQPHVAGTPMDFAQADMLRQFWLDVGLDKAVTTPYNILLSYPDDDIPNLVRIFSNDSDTAELVLESPENEENLTPAEWRDDFPFPNLGYSGNGTVRGDIVYVNYARREDFEYLEEKGINISGKITLARYGYGWRAEKVRFAEIRGALGMMLYSDPADYIAPWATDYYNKSIWIPPTATSRGSIFLGTGDPLTPGYPAIASAYRYDNNDPEPYLGLPKIPAMPIGYDIAEKILGLLAGDPAPEDWSGRLLDGNYRLGPGFINQSYVAELSVHMTNERRDAYNAYGVIRGETEPDRYVMLGNHRDSWVLGAIDPSSGTATMMELSRVLGHLVKEGWWRPRRTIIFCSWGAEEFGLIGSTEWIEENSKILDFRSVAYINMDIAVTGNYSIRGLGSPPVFSAMYRAAQKVPYPNAIDDSTVYDAWFDKRPLIDPETSEPLNVPIINSPGGGSDYGTFQMRAGIPCADFRFDQNYAGDQVLFYPLYHTSYETLYAVEELIDPGFVLHATIGMMSGELLRDLADAKVLPFNMSDYAQFLDRYKYHLVNYNSTLLEHYSISITELEAVIDLYREEAKTFHDTADTVNRNNPFDIRRINDQMMMIDRTFVDPASLPGRSQIYRHLVHSTPETPGIPGSSFPGIEDALYKLEQAPDDPDLIRELQHHFSVLVFVIQSAAYSLKETTEFFREKM